MNSPPPRIIAGQWRGRTLMAPKGQTTRPTNIRARQAVFDMLMHAPWAGQDFVRSARVLDVFAGTGAYGLEALSRGAGFATFLEKDRAALAAIQGNITRCKAENMTKLLVADALHPPAGSAHDMVFLDPPYGQNLVPQAILALSRMNYLAGNALLIAELGPDDTFMPATPHAVREHGKARIVFWLHSPHGS